MREPCMCGASDCPECYPQNFSRGRYIFAACSECFDDFEPKDAETLCPDCQRKADGIRECTECGEDFKASGDETICPPCQDVLNEMDDHLGECP